MRNIKTAGPLLALLAALCLLPVPALAAERIDETPPVEAEAEPSTWSPAEAGPENGALFAAYVDQCFFGNAVKPAASRDPEGDRLAGLDQKLYDALKRSIKEVAASGGSTEFTVTCSELSLKTSWTSEDLNGYPVLTGDALTPRAIDAVSDAVGFSAGRVFYALLADLPYELYWLDRTGPSIAWSVPVPLAVPKTDEAPASVRLSGDFLFTFSVAPDYQDGGGAAVTPEVAAVGAAAKRAQAIAAACRNESDSRKLLAFQEELRALAGPGGKAEPGGAFGDPWQMVRALDGDPGTEASSEGWSKAFQCLCVLSGLQDAKCYTVSGLVQENEAAPKPHMWNIVRIGGKSYLADVSASLDGGVGRDGGLFLAGTRIYEETTPASYAASVPSGTVFYWYEGGESERLGEEILLLADTDFDPLSDPAYAADGARAKIGLASGFVMRAVWLLIAVCGGSAGALVG